MNGGLGGGNGFMFRTRRQEDAEAFVKEYQGKQRPHRPSRAATVVVMTAVLIVAVLGLVDWLG